MLCIIRDKFIRLARGEDGVAFVTTLAVFMFVYLVCMGVYAIGTAVKTRIHLQNACDAAAYSAALVQADTLSRIATINRAMAWTYVQVSRRQMDWISYRWLKEVRQHWLDDYARAKEWAAGSTAICSWVDPHHGLDWNCSPITLYGARQVSSSISESTIQNANLGFRTTHEGDGPSFYASSSMTEQIEEDWKTIAKMGDAINALKKTFNESVEFIVTEVVRANLPTGVRLSLNSSKCFFEKMEAYTEVLPNESDEEDRFLSYIGMTRQSAFGNSGSQLGGANSWFVRKPDPNLGFRRGYNWGNNSALKATWSWKSYQWHCKKGEHGEDIHIPPIPCPSCTHPSHFRCECTGEGQFYTRVYADNDASRHDPYYETPREYVAMPNKLKKSYFEKEGTITVGLVCENQNPWTTILGDTIQGLFSAFNIGGGVNPLYTVCFASAKAGYKNTLNWNNTSDIENDRAYHVDWQNEEEWNLCQSDWDAVLIPVRMSQTLASGGSWGAGNLNFLDEYANDLGVSDSDMKAGGDGLDISKHYGNRDLGEEYRFGNQAGFWGGAAPATSQDNSGAVKAKWQIGNPNERIDWNGLQKVMFH